VTPDGEKQWLSADGNWYPTESAALLAGIGELDAARELGPVPSLPPKSLPPAVPRIAEGNGKKGKVLVIIPNAKYLGGHGSEKHPVSGNLIVRDGRIGIGMGRTPRAARVVLVPGASIRVESAMIAKSRAGKALMFGVLALAAKNQQNAAYLTIDLANGLAATYQVAGISGPELAARLRGPLGVYGVRI
jgi:hypothetical protein